MKSLSLLFSIVLAVFIASGCGMAARQIQTKSQSGKSDVFTEVYGDSPLPKGFADLIIKANIKTHREGYYMLESRASLHGKEKYPFIVNIDGQAVRWEVTGIRNEKPRYDAEGKTSLDPEAGDGMKYVLERKVRTAVGSHNIFLGLPEKNYFVEVELLLREGETSTLEFRPVYRTKRLPTRIPSFLKGIENYEVFLNDEKIL